MSVTSLTAVPSGVASIAATASTRSGNPTVTGFSACRRAKLSSCRVKDSPRLIANSIARAARWPFGSCATTRFILSMCPLTIISILLKSCAMPPVSWPIASIFCV